MAPNLMSDVKGKSPKWNKNCASETFQWSPLKTIKGHTKSTEAGYAMCRDKSRLRLARTLANVLGFTEYP